MNFYLVCEKNRFLIRIKWTKPDSILSDFFSLQHFQLINAWHRKITHIFKEFYIAGDFFVENTAANMDHLADRHFENNYSAEDAEEERRNFLSVLKAFRYYR